MSDAHDEGDPLGRLAIRGSQLEPIRERMRSFLAEREEADESDPVEDLTELREATATGRPLSDVVEEGRRERFEE